MTDLTTVLIIVAVVIVVIAVIISICWRKAATDKAIVVTGLRKRVITGGGSLVIPFLEQTNTISLESMKVEIGTEGSLDSNGVPISTRAVAVLKIKSDTKSILSAMEQFNTGKLGETIQVIKDTSREVLEGKLREIISKMSVEEIYRDREEFANKVEQVATPDLSGMGLEIKTFTIKDIDDDQGYLQALGAKQIAEVKKDAAIAEAEAEKEKAIKTAEAKRLGKQAQLEAETKIAEAEKDKELKVEDYRAEQSKAKAKADIAYSIEKNINQKQVVQSEKDAELLKEQRETEIATQQALRAEKELDANVRKQADAEKYKQEKRADAERYALEQQAEAEKVQQTKRAEAESEKIRLIGKAEAESIKLKGEATAEAMKAEAEAMIEKAEAYKQYGEAAKLQMLIEVLPKIAESIAKPLEKVDKITIIDGGEGKGGASKLTSSVASMVSQVPEVVRDLTGLDLIEMLKGVLAKEGKKEEVIDDSLIEKARALGISDEDLKNILGK